MVCQEGNMPAQQQTKSLQCQYPAGCSNERTLKRNGERHWLCKSHRDRQNTLQRERYQRKRPAKKQKVASRSSGAAPGTGKRRMARASRKVDRIQARKKTSTVQVEAVSEGETHADAIDDSSSRPSESTQPSVAGPRSLEASLPAQPSNGVPVVDQALDAVASQVTDARSLSAIPLRCHAMQASHIPRQDHVTAFALPAAASGVQPLVVILLQAVPVPCICGCGSAGPPPDPVVRSAVGQEAAPGYEAQMCPVVLQLPHPTGATAAPQGLGIPSSQAGASPPQCQPATPTPSSVGLAAQSASAASSGGMFVHPRSDGHSATPHGVDELNSSIPEDHGALTSVYLI